MLDEHSVPVGAITKQHYIILARKNSLARSSGSIMILVNLINFIFATSKIAY